MVDRSGGTPSDANEPQWKVVRVDATERRAVFTGFTSETAALAFLHLAKQIEAARDLNTDAKFGVVPTPAEELHAAGAWDSWLPANYAETANGAQPNKLQMAVRANGDALWILSRGAKIVGGGATRIPAGQSKTAALVESVFHCQPRAASAIQAGTLKVEEIPKEQAEAFFADHLEPASFGYYEREMNNVKLHRLQAGDIIVTSTNTDEPESVSSVLRAQYSADLTTLATGWKMGKSLAGLTAKHPTLAEEAGELVRPARDQRLSGYLIRGLERVVVRPHHQMQPAVERTAVTKAGVGGRGARNEFKGKAPEELAPLIFEAEKGANASMAKLSKYLSPEAPQTDETDAELTLDQLEGPSPEEMGVSPQQPTIDPAGIPAADRLALIKVEDRLKVLDNMWNAYKESTDGNRGVRGFVWDEVTEDGEPVFKTGNTVFFYDNSGKPNAPRPRIMGTLVADAVRGHKLQVSVQLDRDETKIWSVDLRDVRKVRIAERVTAEDFFDVDVDALFSDDAPVVAATNTADEPSGYTEIVTSVQFRKVENAYQQAKNTLTAIRNRRPALPEPADKAQGKQKRSSRQMRLAFDLEEGYTVSGEAVAMREAYEAEMSALGKDVKGGRLWFGAEDEAIKSGSTDLEQLGEKVADSKYKLAQVDDVITKYSALILDEFGGGFSNKSSLLTSGGHRVFVAIEGEPKPVAMVATGRTVENKVELLRPSGRDSKLMTEVTKWSESLGKNFALKSSGKPKIFSDVAPFRIFEKAAGPNELTFHPIVNIRGIQPMQEDGRFAKRPDGRNMLVRTEPTIVKKIDALRKDADLLAAQVVNAEASLKALRALAGIDADNDAHSSVEEVTEQHAKDQATAQHAEDQVTAEAAEAKAETEAAQAKSVPKGRRGRGPASDGSLAG